MSYKRNRNEKEQPLQVPLYIPTEGGAGALVLGKGVMRGDTLIIDFNDKLPAQAIKHRIERGGIVGITFVIPDEEAEAYRESEAQREKDATDLALLREDDELAPDDLKTD